MGGNAVFQGNTKADCPLRVKTFINAAARQQASRASENGSDPRGRVGKQMPLPLDLRGRRKFNGVSPHAGSKGGEGNFTEGMQDYYPGSEEGTSS